MTLQKLLSPIKAVDERILKGYTEISQGISNDKLYKICLGMDIFSFPGVIVLLSNLTSNFTLVGKIIVGSVNGFTLAQDGILSWCGLAGYFKKNKDTGETTTLHPVAYTAKEVTQVTRLPIFIAGVSLLGKAVYDVGNSFFNGEPLTNETFNFAGGGLGYLSLASSMYLKDRNPKLLDKKPLWKKTTEYLKEKTKIKIPIWERSR